MSKETFFFQKYFKNSGQVLLEIPSINKLVSEVSGITLIQPILTCDDSGLTIVLICILYIFIYMLCDSKDINSKVLDQCNVLILDALDEV